MFPCRRQGASKGKTGRALYSSTPYKINPNYFPTESKKNALHHGRLAVAFESDYVSYVRIVCTYRTLGCMTVPVALGVEFLPPGAIIAPENLTVRPPLLSHAGFVSPSPVFCHTGAKRRHSRPRGGRPGVASSVRGGGSVDAGGGAGDSRGPRVRACVCAFGHV